MDIISGLIIWILNNIPSLFCFLLRLKSNLDMTTCLDYIESGLLKSILEKFLQVFIGEKSIIISNDELIFVMGFCLTSMWSSSPQSKLFTNHIAFSWLWTILDRLKDILVVVFRTVAYHMFLFLAFETSSWPSLTSISTYSRFCQVHSDLLALKIGPCQSK